MLAALQIIDAVRTAGEPLTGRAFLVARDAAMADGAWLKVTSNRTVNVRKANRPQRFGISRASYEMWRGNTNQTLPFRFATLTEQLEGFVMPPGSPRLARVGSRDLEFRPRATIDLGGAVAGDVIHINGEPFQASRLLPEMEWDSDRIFREDTDAQIAARELMDAINARPRLGMRVTGVDYERSTITLAAHALRGQHADMMIIDEARPVPKSRVPAHVQANRKRLDGRRR